MSILSYRQRKDELALITQLLQVRMVVHQSPLEGDASNEVRRTALLVQHNVTMHIELEYKLALLVQDPLLVGLSSLRRDMSDTAHEFGCFDSCVPQHTETDQSN